MAYRLLTSIVIHVGPMRSLPLSRTRGMRRSVPLESFSRTEKIISFCRVVLAVVTFFVTFVDPKQPSFAPSLGQGVLTAYVVFSLVLFLLVRGEHVRQERIGLYSAIADVCWVTLISLFTERGPSPFFLLHVFVILSVSARWGLAGALPVAAVLAGVYPALIYFASHWYDPGSYTFHRSHLIRPIYILVLGYLIGFLGEHERRAKRKLAFMLDLTSAFQGRRAPGRALTRLMRRALTYFGGQRGILVLRDPDTQRYFTWAVSRTPGHRPTVSLRITTEDPLPLRFCAPTEGFLANDLGTALCYDVVSGGMRRRSIEGGLCLPVPGMQPQAVIAAPVLVQRDLRGHALVIRDTRRKFTRDDLEFLLLLVGQGAAGFEANRLQQKAEQVAVLEERARIARDLHDGFIQSLAGIDLRVEALKLLLQRDPNRIPRALEDLHQAVDQGYREVRHYLAVLRNEGRQADDLAATLDRLAEEFATRDHLAVHVVGAAAVTGLSPEASYDVTQIVREALRNAVRHGGATEAVVKLGMRATQCVLVVRDNGRGFADANGARDAEGFLAASAHPWSIRERTAAMGGTLRVWSQPGRGAEITVTLPVGSGAAQETERRRYA